MKNYQKGFAPLVLITVIVLIAIGIGGYFIIKSRVAVAPTGSPDNTSIPTTQPGWKAITWHDPNNPILGYRFDMPDSWIEISNPYGSERQITVASCPSNTCDQMSFDIQVIARGYTPNSILPSGWTKTKVNIGGISTDKITEPTGSAELIEINFMRDGNWYKLEFYTSNTNKLQAEPIFDHILETFTFTAAQEQRPPVEYSLLKNTAQWTLTYQAKNTSTVVCTNGNRGKTTKNYVFEMSTQGDTNNENIPGDIDPPYGKVITTLQNNGWQQCKAIGKTELQDTQGTSEVFIKSNKLIGVFRHYSMGVGNSLTILIQY